MFETTFNMDRYLLPPELPAPRQTVLPAFIPFAGCPGRCIYCAQTLQTRQPPTEHLAQIKRSLEAVLTGAEAGGHHQAELAFYGGTFTLLPEAWQEELLGSLTTWRERGVIGPVRCSTRPDAVPDETLRRLKALGLTGIELGVQTFSDAALAKSGRGYTGDAAVAACARVQTHGFTLGVQLLPGLPGMDEAMFQADVEACLEIGPNLARLYPCLVLKDTPLAESWATGEYRPWGLERVVPLLAAALLKFQKARIKVIRMGLPLGDDFEQHILAGPVHPALGDMVRGLALHYWLKEQMNNAPQPANALCVPHAWQGAFWGHKGELKPTYAALGLTPDKITFWDWPIFRFRQG